MVDLNKQAKKKKLLKKENRFAVSRGRGWGGGNWMKVVERYKLSTR